MTFKAIEDVFSSCLGLFSLPERLNVPQAAEKYRKLDQPGAYVGDWLNSKVPYMTLPGEMITDRFKRAVVFVGPSQSSKTELLLNWLLYSAVVDPMDMIIFCPSHSAAKDFSIRRVDRMNDKSPEVGKRLVLNRDSDTRFIKMYQDGMIFTLSWPSKTELAGRPIGRVGMTDFDRMPMDVDGEGNPFDLAQKRTTSFLSYAMIVAESSPSKPVINPRWIARYRHEAPPCEGILAIYNRGDMRRWYWPCPKCEDFFMPVFELLKWDTTLSDSSSAAATVAMECPCCQHMIRPAQRNLMNIKGLWVAEGQTIVDGKLVGEPWRNTIASFWLEGTAAAFATWSNLVENYLNAVRVKENTGSEEELKKFFNNDLGRPYVSESQMSDRLPETLKNRAAVVPRGHVPEDVRFLLAQVDIQISSFVVSIHGIRPGMPRDLVLIDYFKIWESERTNEAGRTYQVQPHVYLDDWNLLVDKVINASYPLADGSGRRMRVRVTCSDSGGKEGATEMAYGFYRKMRSEGLSGRFHLVKGSARLGMPASVISYPDTSASAKLAKLKADIPLYTFNSNQLKDTLSAMLDCAIPGKGQYVIPDWVDDSFYEEMTNEIRTHKGWENIRKRRNEAWDLAYYCLGMCHAIGVDSWDWDKPPSWAAPWDTNTMVSLPDGQVKFAKPSKPAIDFAALGKQLA